MPGLVVVRADPQVAIDAATGDVHWQLYQALYHRSMQVMACAPSLPVIQGAHSLHTLCVLLLATHHTQTINRSEHCERTSPARADIPPVQVRVVGTIMQLVVGSPVMTTDSSGILPCTPMLLTRIRAPTRPPVGGSAASAAWAF